MTLDQIIDMGHPLVRLAALIDLNILNESFSAVCQAGSGQPSLPERLVAGLSILKHMHNLSDEVLCARWIENPYYLCHERWRGRRRCRVEDGSLASLSLTTVQPGLAPWAYSSLKFALAQD